MATKKAAGTARNLKDSQPKYLGIKLSDGEKAKVGSIIVRQRGTVVLPGSNVGLGKDHTIFALKEGLVKFTSKKKTKFDGKTKTHKVANVI